MMNIEPKHFSDYFNINKSRLNELGVFDPILNYDTKVFVEPLLLKNSSSEIIKNSDQHYTNYFSQLLLLLHKSQNLDDKCWRVAKKMVNFPEYQYTCIGYGSGSTEGKGSGVEFNDKILNSAKEIVDLADNNPEIFLLLPLLEEGIAGDRISDMVQNIIDEDICKYTQKIMGELNLESNYEYTTRNHNSYKLLLNPYSKLPIKLIPTDILLNLPVADNLPSLIEEMSSHNSKLRNLVNRDIGQIWINTTKSYRKSILLKELKTNKEFFVETLKALKEYKLEHYDLKKDYEGLYKWLENSQDFINVELSKEIKNCPDSLESIEFAITGIIKHFRDVIENKNVWRTFWTKYASDYRHVRVFYSQMLFFTVCNTWLTSQDSNVIINLKHSEKNIDLEFTISGKYKLLVHIKHANNTSLYNGYKNILEKHRNSTDTCNYYLVMNFKIEESDQLNRIKIIENPICKIFEIDVTQQEIKKPHDHFKAIELNFDDIFLGFENIEFYNYVEEKGKGGKKKHANTTIVKTEVIKPMFLYRKQLKATAKISEIANSIINELNSLQENKTEEKILKFMNKYSINSNKAIEAALGYIKNNDDGGQISIWCYQLSNKKF